MLREFLIYFAIIACVWVVYIIFMLVSEYVKYVHSKCTCTCFCYNKQCKKRSRCRKFKRTSQKIISMRDIIKEKKRMERRKNRVSYM